MNIELNKEKLNKYDMTTHRHRLTEEYAGYTMKESGLEHYRLLRYFSHNN